MTSQEDALRNLKQLPRYENICVWWLLVTKSLPCGWLAAFLILGNARFPPQAGENKDATPHSNPQAPGHSTHRGETLRKARVQDLLPGLSSGRWAGNSGHPHFIRNPSWASHCFPISSPGAWRGLVKPFETMSFFSTVRWLHVPSPNVSKDL